MGLRDAQKTDRLWRWIEAGGEGEDQDTEGVFQVSSWSSRKEGAAVCRNRERTGFWGEIMSLISDMFSLKDL